jgi:hypothetical protein
MTESSRPKTDTFEAVAAAFTAAERQAAERRAWEGAYSRRWPGLLVRDSKLPQVASGGGYL